MSNAGGEKEKRKTEKKVEGLCPGGNKENQTLRGRCAGQETV